MEYGLLEIAYTNADEGRMRGLLGMQVSSVKTWEKQVRKNVEESIEEWGDFNISHSDNAEDRFESVEDVMSKITFKTVSKAEFEVLANYLSTADERKYAQANNTEITRFKIGAIPYETFDYQPKAKNKPKM